MTDGPRPAADEGALVLFSGGQDSSVCLAWALERFPRVETIGFDYGQRHRVELKCRAEILERLPLLNDRWSERLGPDHIIGLEALGQISETALTRDSEIDAGDAGLPNTFVPGRNLLFFTLAAALASPRRLRHLVGGMCETDYSGYPDCRDDTIKALQVTLNLGMAERFVLHTPLMWSNKAEAWRMAADMGGQELVDLIRFQSHSCYLGERKRRHDWGYGCGDCPACELRRTGYLNFISIN